MTVQAKIRTYNYPQGRVTDHRIGLTVHALERVLAGDLGDIVQALRNVERTERLKQAGLVGRRLSRSLPRYLRRPWMFSSSLKRFEGSRLFYA